MEGILKRRMAPVELAGARGRLAFGSRNAEAVHVEAAPQPSEPADARAYRGWEPPEAFDHLDAVGVATLEAILNEFSTSSRATYEHGVRVAGMAVPLGYDLGLRDAGLADLACGALLHDIGKMAMPEGLLDKPGPLTDREHAIMRAHPRLGHDLIRVAPCLRPVADVVLASHERFDGTGYPKGLAGPDIPLAARITSVVDAFVAIMEPRAYRPPRSLVNACAELVSGAGSQFDPNVVHVWLRLLDSPGAEGHWNSAIHAAPAAAVQVEGAIA